MHIRTHSIKLTLLEIITQNVDEKCLRCTVNTEVNIVTHLK